MSCLVVQSFGNETEYRRASFCLVSYVAHHPKQKDAFIILFTDAPDFFKKLLPDFNIRYVALTPQKIKLMRGDIDFLHRMKIALIEEAFEIYNGPILYADSDTFFISDPTPLINRLSPETAFMHVLEYPFSKLERMPLPAGETFQAFFKLITSQQFKGASGQTIAVTPEHASWNAGVMLFHPSHKKFIADVYALTDQFYPATKNHASEQYAFSLVVQMNTRLEPCDSVVYHYWYRVKKTIMDGWLKDFFSDWQRHNANETFEHVKTLTKKLPGLLANHALTLRDNAIQAFHEDRFLEGYRFSLRLLLKKPFDFIFMRDVAYHTRRLLKNG